ncbi:MAG: DUF5685 family protein, partial [Thermoanaerobacterium sp.]|nr:DUF5685 family protein [Thermoanaerobacterium sp.]
FLDDKQDDKTLNASLLEFFFKTKFRKSYKLYSKKAKKIKEYLEVLKNLEETRCSSVDVASEPFANVMKEVFLKEDLKIDDEDYSKVGEIAYHLGRYIYILDAYDDLKEDLKNGSYNPFIYQYNLSYKQTGNDEMEHTLKEIKEWTKFNLTFTLFTIVKLYEQLKFKKNVGIIDNIFRVGLYMEFMRIMEGDKSCKIRTKS